MDTIEEEAPLGRRRRRPYSVELKAQVVAACQGPGASLAAIALHHNLNANLLRRWVEQAERNDCVLVARSDVAAPSAAAFVPLPLEMRSARTAEIRIEVHRADLSATVSWPTSEAGLAARVARVIRIDEVWLAVEQIFARAGLAIPQSTLGAWVGTCGAQLQPLVDALHQELLQRGVLHADETPVQMLSPVKGRPTGRICGRIRRRTSVICALWSTTSPSAAQASMSVHCSPARFGQASEVPPS